MRVSIIVAIAQNGVIGRDGRLPWRLSSDLRRFKQLTMGHHIVMGRKTFESIGRLLPGRTSIVITRSPEYAFAGAHVGHSLDQALQLANGDDEVFIIGGGEIYDQAIDLADRLLVTRVEQIVEGDVCFPDYDSSQWRLVHHESFAADEKNDHPHSFEVYERTRPRRSSERHAAIAE